MKPYISIGITTYKDLSDPVVAREIYRAYENLVPKLTPTEISIWQQKWSVADVNGFVENWLQVLKYKKHADREREDIIESGVFRLGAEWKQKGLGGGQVRFRPENQNDREDTILIKHPYLARINWLVFFSKLVDICEPSYAMINLFTEAEIKGDKSSRFEAFDGAVAGEANFTHWKASSGVWRKPDKWDRKARRVYRFLPELSWANFLGKEFEGQYNSELLQRSVSNCIASETGLLFSLTDSISDVVKAPENFTSKRLKARNAFKDGFFRLPNS